jgi:hypothetical protein
VDAAGQSFSDQGRTALVTLHGAAIVLKRNLAPGQQVTIRCYGTGIEAAARVVGQIESQPGGFLYGVQFLDPEVNPWNIKFPARDSLSPAVGRLLLQCAGCQTLELVYLDELEVEVFGANQCLSRACSVCQKDTLWKSTPHEMAPAQAVGESPLEPSELSVSALIPRTRNDRKHVRAKIKLKACIRHPETGEDIVECADVSRGGLCFLSQKQYAKDALIEASVPYLPGQANIFVRARIANSRSVPGETGGFKYGVEYIT